MPAVFFALALFCLGNALGTAALGARGFGLISFRRSTRPGRWRAPVARLSGPLLVYLFAAGLFAVTLRCARVPTAQIKVVPGLPAEAAGLQDGDRILAVDGSPVTTFGQIADRVRETGPGGTSELSVQRGESRLATRVTLDAEGRAGVQPSGELTVRSWPETLLGALAGPFQAGASSFSAIWSIIRAPPRPLEPPPVGRLIAMLEHEDPETSRLWFVRWLATVSSLIWYLVLLVALTTQLIAWMRGEERSASRKPVRPA